MKDYEVFLSPLAEFKLDKLLKNIELNWGERTKNKFLDKLEKKVQQVANFPQSSPKSRINDNIRKSVISPQTSLYIVFTMNL